MVIMKQAKLLKAASTRRKIRSKGEKTLLLAHARGAMAFMRCREMSFPKNGSLRLYNVAWKFTRLVPWTLSVEWKEWKFTRHTPWTCSAQRFASHILWMKRYE
jgi:hypothetical protein